MSYSFPKAQRLRKKREFHRVNRYGTSRLGKFLSVTIQKSYYYQARLGITVTKRYGKAHDRNRFKRLVREAFRQMKNSLPSHSDILVKPRSNPDQLNLANVSEELKELILNAKGRTASHESSSFHPRQTQS